MTQFTMEDIAQIGLLIWAQKAQTPHEKPKHEGVPRVSFWVCDRRLELAAYEISEEAIAPAKPTTAPAVAVAGTGGGATSRPFPFIGVIGFLWISELADYRVV